MPTYKLPTCARESHSLTHPHTCAPSLLPNTHKHTQPMELSARPDVGALDRLATPPTGAGAIPAAALAGLKLEDHSSHTTGTSGYKTTTTHTVQLAA